MHSGSLLYCTLKPYSALMSNELSIFFPKAMKTECKKGRIIPKNIHEGPLKLMGRYRLLNEEDSNNMGALPNTGME